MSRRSRRGVTLVEALVAISIIVVMSGLAVSLMSTMIQTREVLAERDETTRTARAVMSTVRRQLQLLQAVVATTILAL